LALSLSRRAGFFHHVKNDQFCAGVSGHGNGLFKNRFHVHGQIRGKKNIFDFFGHWSFSR
jgi:protein involved in ribonucleotide reduction